MKSGNGSGAVFRYHNWFRMFIMPGSNFLNHLISDQFAVACIAVPSKIAVDTNYIEKLRLEFNNNIFMKTPQ